MRETDLRIGNRILSKRNSTEWHEIEVDVPNLQLINNSDYINAFKPIPLTEEWLLKFGGKYNIGWIVGAIELEEDEGEFYYQLDSGRLKINYVHQLQNLHFALSNTELPISS